MKKHDPPSTKKVYNFLEDSSLPLEAMHEDKTMHCNDNTDTIPDNFIPGQTSNFKIHQTIENYQILKELGQGGMGKVYLAYDKTVQRQVVLKFILRDVPKNLKRFLREAEAASSLDHPHIIRVYNVFFFREKPCIVMQYVEGNTLLEYVKKNNLCLEKKLEIIKKIAKSLHYAHLKGIIHRDVKPSNILIDKNGEPWLMDFGLAKITTNNVGKDITKTGEIMGSPGYMSPEQARGQRNIASNTDVYSLGVVLYELLTEQEMFSTENIMSFLYNVIHTTPKSPRAINKEIPMEVERICLKSIEKNPSLRYQTCEKMARDIERFAKGNISAVTTAIQYHAEKTVFYRETSVMLLFLALVGVTITCIYIFVKPPEKDESYYNNLDSNILVSDALLEKALFYHGKKSYKKAEEDYNLAIEKYPNIAKNYYHRGLLYKDLALHQKALQDFTKAIDLNPNNAQLYKERGTVLFNISPSNRIQALGDLEKALELSPDNLEIILLCAVYYLPVDIAKSQEYFEKALSIDPKYPDTLYHLGYIQQVLGNLEKAKQYYNRALAISPQHYYSMFHLSTVLRSEKNTSEAKKLLAACISQNPGDAGLYWEMGNCFLAEKKYQDALDLYSEALAIKKDPNWYGYRASVYYTYLKNYKQAQQDLDIAYQLSPKSPQVLIYFINFYKITQNQEKALKFCKEYIQLDVDKSDPYFYRADTYQYFQQYDKAISDYDQAIERNPQIHYYYYYRGNVHKKFSQPQKAIEDFTKALSLSKELEVQCLSSRHEAYKALGFYQEALQDIQKAIQISPDNPNLYIQRAYVYVPLGMLDNAKKDFLYAIQIDNSIQNYQSLISYYKDQNMHEKALEVIAEAEQQGFDLLGAKADSLLEEGLFKELKKFLESRTPNAEVYFWFARMYEKQKEHELAIQNYSKAIKIKPDGISPYFLRAKIYAYSGSRQNEALQDLAKVLKEQPQHIQALEIRIAIYTSKKMFDLAIKDCETLSKITSQPDAVHEELGKIYSLMGELQKAEEHYNKAIELQPSKSDYYWKRANIYTKQGKTQKALEDIEKYKILKSKK